jgi:saccharopine dehydrogenase-like NADP-dependent oxidoreductase
MAARMEHTENDRDLVVMRHNFVLENAKKERWAHSSTWIESGAAKVSGGYSLMSKSVGVTAGIGARLVLEGKVKRTGVVTPMYKDVYGPILQILETKFGIAMTEESERPDGLPSSTRAKL